MTSDRPGAQAGKYIPALWADMHGAASDFPSGVAPVLLPVLLFPMADGMIKNRSKAAAQQVGQVLISHTGRRIREIANER